MVERRGRVIAVITSCICMSNKLRQDETLSTNQLGAVIRARLLMVLFNVQEHGTRGTGTHTHTDQIYTLDLWVIK